MNYKYVIVGDIQPDEWKITDELADGYEVIRAIATASAVHYILRRSPPQQLSPNARRTEDLDPDQPDDLKPPKGVVPIDSGSDNLTNLDDIPF
jgi:hypothetical protein